MALVSTKRKICSCSDHKGVMKKLPADPACLGGLPVAESYIMILDPRTWAWGRHPDNGLDYKARDNLEVEVCLANPSMINTAKCKLPLDVCLANPQYLSSLGCSGNDLPPLREGSKKK